MFDGVGPIIIFWWSTSENFRSIMDALLSRIGEELHCLTWYVTSIGCCCISVIVGGVVSSLKGCCG